MMTRYAMHVAVVGLAALLISATAGASNLSELSGEITSLVKRVSPSIVELRVQQHSLAFFDAEGKVTVGSTRKVARKSVGSGFVIDPAGYILTTANVVGNAERITVGFPDGSEAQAELIGCDQITNTAVVKVDKTGLAALEMGDSDTLEPGALVVTVNNLAGMEGSVSLGVVAGVQKTCIESG